MAGKKMPLSVAQKMVSDYNINCNDGDIHSFKIDAAFIRNVIDQQGCEYVRVFVCIDGDVDKNRIGLAPGQTLIVIGADKNGKNIKFGEDDTEVYEDMVPCPPACNDPDGSIL